MNRRELLKAAVSVSLTVVVGHSEAAQVRLAASDVTWKCWHVSAILNQQWRARIDDELGGKKA